MTYKDYSGRFLVTTEVVLGDSLGREVRGLLNGSEPYSCSYEIWERTWLRRMPPADPKGFKDG